MSVGRHIGPLVGHGPEAVVSSLVYCGDGDGTYVGTLLRRSSRFCVTLLGILFSDTFLSLVTGDWSQQQRRGGPCPLAAIAALLLW